MGSRKEMEKWYKVVLICNHIFDDVITKKELLSNEEVLVQVNKSLEKECISEQDEDLVGELEVVVTINEKNINFVDIGIVKNTNKIHIRETYKDRGDFTEVVVVFQKINQEQ